MKERPIIFSGEMVRAILEGRKTQTRRVIKPQPSNIRKSPFSKSGLEDIHGWEIKLKYGQPGDRLWVRERWWMDEDDQPAIFYASTDKWSDIPMKSPIFMPRWASRITLEIVSVRVEKLQNISDDDAIQEGVDRKITSIFGYATERYRKLWNYLNAKRGYSWASNPWVWVIEFKEMVTK
jgi:hypothetical protein